jgi:hypothetical protein
VLHFSWHSLNICLCVFRFWFVQGKICAQLDSALLTNEEWTAYNAKWASLPDPKHDGTPQ